MLSILMTSKANMQNLNESNGMKVVDGKTYTLAIMACAEEAVGGEMSADVCGSQSMQSSCIAERKASLAEVAKSLITLDGY